jgi:hypothetical protein
MSGYREAGNEGQPREVEVSSLQPRTRERLAAVIGGGSSLLSLRPLVLLPRWSIALLLALGLTLSLLALLPHFGSIDPSRGESDSRKILLAGGLVALAAGAMLGADRARLRRGLPFDPGLYLLPLDLVDARSSRLVVRSLLGLREVTDNRDIHGQGQVSVVHLHFEDGSQFSFPTSATNATRLAADLSALRNSAEQATSQGQNARLLSLDPFAEERGSWPAHPTPLGADRARSPSWPLPIAPLVLPAAFALLAPGLIEARDRASERRCLAVAQRDQDDETLRRIAALSGPLAEQADAARFALARARGTTDALVHYMREDALHPSQADNALHDLCSTAGTNEALEQYLIAGREHRDQVFARLFDRGEKQRDIGALHVYERQHGPRQEEVVERILPRLQMEMARAQEISPPQLRRYIAFSRYQDLRQIARQRLQEQFDLRLAALGPVAPPTPLDPREIIRIARAHDGVLEASLQRVSGKQTAGMVGKKQQRYTPQIEYKQETDLLTIFQRSLQAELDSRLDTDLIKLELSPPPPAGDPPPLQVRYELLSGEEPGFDASSLPAAIRLWFSLHNGPFVEVTTSVTASAAAPAPPANQPQDQVTQVTLRFEEQDESHDYLKRVCKKDGMESQRCVYWRNARHWLPVEIKGLTGLRLLGGPPGDTGR